MYPPIEYYKYTQARLDWYVAPFLGDPLVLKVLLALCLSHCANLLRYVSYTILELYLLLFAYVGSISVTATVP